jgi:hypothetical protein
MNNEEEYIYGRNSVLAFLEASEKEPEDHCQLDKVLLSDSLQRADKRIEQIKKLAKDKRVPVVVSNKL